MPLVSVIMPVYNAEKYLLRAVKSVFAQTLSDFELILVDDGSTDESAELCDEIAEADVRVRVIHQKNGGTSSARNAGVAAARGEYIAFIDNDDYALPNWLSDMYATAVSSGADVVRAGCRCVANDESVLEPPAREAELPDVVMKVTPPDTELDSAGYLRRLALYDDCNAVWTQLCKAPLLKECPFPEGSLGEDVAVGLLLSERADKFRLIPSCGYCWVQRQGSQSRINPRLCMDMIAVYERLETRLEAAGEPDCEALRSLAARKMRYLFYGPLCPTQAAQNALSPRTREIWERVRRDDKKYRFFAELPALMRCQILLYSASPRLYVLAAKIFKRIIAR